MLCVGLVFCPLTQPYLHEYGESWYNSAPRKLVQLAMHGIKQKPDEQVVVLTQVLLDEVNAGYQSLSEAVVKRCAGVEVVNLRQMKQVIEDVVARWKQAVASGQTPSESDSTLVLEMEVLYTVSTDPLPLSSH